MPVFTGIFKEVAVDHKLIVPLQKPPMECIIDTLVDVEVEKAEVIDTPIQVTTAAGVVDLQKIVFVGKVKIKVKYSALVPDQKVHAAHFEAQFCTLIEWPDGPPQGTPITVVPVVEKAVFKMEDGRRIFKAILIRLDVYR